MGLVLALAGVAVLCLPGLVRRLGRRLAPAEWARLCAAALAGGAAMVETALVLSAAPTVLRAAGVPAVASTCERMLGRLAPGGPAAGWVAAVAAILLPALGVVGVRRAMSAWRVVRAEPWLGTHSRHGHHELVVLPTPHPLAATVPGAPGQILVSDGLVEALGDAELAAVLRHESAHLDHHHHRFLLLAAALDHAVGILPPVRRSTAALRLALERWADEAAAGDDLETRTTVRRALVAMSEALLAPAMAAFSSADTVAERLEALGDDPPRPAFSSHVLLYAPGTALGASAVAALATWASNAQFVLAMAGRCA